MKRTKSYTKYIKTDVTEVGFQITIQYSREHYLKMYGLTLRLMGILA